ncbi:MAG TPA: copper ion binding protein, partial [Deltaproteobacteria bacterium]|nr:copper ion binding protein [Deltaproteobacteria bacterium]
MSEQTITLPISGMTCANCALNIERGVKKLEGIKQTSVNFAAEEAMVSFDPKSIQFQDIFKRIHDSGYTVPTAESEFPVTGMTCANCAMNIERALNKKVLGVVNASVNFATERVSVEYVPTVSTMEEIISAIKKAGYGAVPPEDVSDAEDAEQLARQAEIKDQTQKFIVGVVFALPLFAISMLRDFNLIGMWSHAPWMNWLFLLLAT